MAGALKCHIGMLKDTGGNVKTMKNKGVTTTAV